ncbi:hypothetical protein [Caballeronia sp. LZ035]|uniref:hypothetical protein n=1 Tax=Caballeronia sp. LZ035 TaxID=3038568 RepID=UPI00285C5156|nr:hypothetical protein [Caballeronia sp. LZ035]MDR5761549.1 hypothetical protein [Caballeronia sp. LZ035]
MTNEVYLRDIGFIVRRRPDYLNLSYEELGNRFHAELFLDRRAEWSTNLFIMPELSALIGIHGMAGFDAYEDIERAVRSGELQVELKEPEHVFVSREVLPPPPRARTYTPEQLWPRAAPDATPAKLKAMAARLDCSYLDGSRRRIDAPAELYKHVNPVTASTVDRVMFDFPADGRSPAFRKTATVHGRSVDVFTPLGKPAEGYALPNGDRVIKALEVLKPQQTQDLTRVSLNTQMNPEDAYWATKYGEAGFSSGATAEIEQGVAIFPWKDWRDIPQEYVDSTMSHETGHLWSQSLWKDGSKKQAWLDAMASDGKAPSDYARRNENEDFAESVNMYFSSLGSPCEERGREKYPARYRYLDRHSK